MKNKALITGITGQDGSYLAELLISKGYEVHGIVRRSSSFNTGRIDHLYQDLHDTPQLVLHYGDLTDGASLRKVLSKVQPDEVYNLGAQSHVRVSFDQPVYTAAADAVGALSLLEAVQDVCPNVRYYQAGSCYDVETRVMTKAGLKYYNEIDKDDLIYTLNPETRQVELCPIDKIIVNEYVGKLTHFTGRHMNLMVTPHHRVYYQRDGELCLGSDYAKNIGGLIYQDRISHISLPTSVFVGTLDEYVDFKNYVSVDSLSDNIYKNKIDKMLTKDFLYILGLYIGDGFTDGAKTRKRSMSKKQLTLKSRTSLGYFPSLPKTETVVYVGHRLGFALPKNTEPRKKLIDILRRYNVEYDDNDDITLYFTSYILAEVLKLSGSNVYEKRIPEQFFHYDASLLQFLFEGLMDSDGHTRIVKEKRYSYSTVSKVLANDLVVLSYKLGMIPQLKAIPSKQTFFKKENRYFNTRESYAIGVSVKRTNKFYRHNIKDVNYSGLVWCLSLPKNHNFLVERCGQFAFSGNSEQFGKVQCIPQNEDTPFYPRSPYGCAKVFAHYQTMNYREAYGMFACNGILFNHESKRRGETFVTRKITRAATRIKEGLQQYLYLGNLDAKRDWGFAGDYVEAMWLMLQQDKPDDFVIATGETHSVQDFVVEAFSILGLDWQEHVRKDERYFRPTEVDLLLGDSSKARRVLGWVPKVGFKALVQMMVESDWKLAKQEKMLNVQG